MNEQKAEFDHIPLRAQPTDLAARVVDRDGDVWARHEGRWGCLTFQSTPQAWVDLWHVLGPLTLATPPDPGPGLRACCWDGTHPGLPCPGIATPPGEAGDPS